MLVYGVGTSNSVKAAYDYRAFGEQVDLTLPADKVTENFTGKERDDETGLGYFGARYLDQMLGMWVSVDKKREYQNSYSYVGYNPVNAFDPNGMDTWSLGVTGGGSIGLIGAYVGLNVEINPNAKSIGDGIFLSASIRTGVGYSLGASGRIRAGYSSEDPKSGPSAAIVRAGTVPIVGGILGINENTEVGSDKVSHSVDLGLGAEVGGELQAETSISGSLNKILDKVGKFFNEKMDDAINTDYATEGGTD